MKVLLVDDEAPARSRMKRLLEKYPDIEIVGEAGDGLSALEKIEILNPEILFLDIEMPELDGIGVARALQGSSTSPEIVFVTAYSEHALKAFELAAADYLVKPVDAVRLDATINRLSKRRTDKSRPKMEELFETLEEESALRRLALRCGSRYVVFDPAKISAILAKDHYAAILVDGKEFLADDSLDVVAKKLNSKLFMRIHRSAVINIDFLKELEREGDRKYTAVLNDPQKTRVPVSREQLNLLKAKLGIN